MPHMESLPTWPYDLDPSLRPHSSGATVSSFHSLLDINSFRSVSQLVVSPPSEASHGQWRCRVTIPPINFDEFFSSVIGPKAARLEGAHAGLVAILRAADTQTDAGSSTGPGTYNRLQAHLASYGLEPARKVNTGSGKFLKVAPKDGVVLLVSGPPPYELVQADDSDPNQSGFTSDRVVGRSVQEVLDKAAASLQQKIEPLIASLKPHVAPPPAVPPGADRHWFAHRYDELRAVATDHIFQRVQTLTVAAGSTFTSLWIQRHLRREVGWVALDMEGLHSEGASALPALVQLATADEVLVTSAVSCSHLLDVLTDARIKKVGKDLQADFSALAAILRASNYHTLPTSPSDAGWLELNLAVPPLSRSAPMDTVCLMSLGRRYGWKGLVDHQSCPPPWHRLQDVLPHEIEYAASDVAVIPCILAAMADGGAVDLHGSAESSARRSARDGDAQKCAQHRKAPRILDCRTLPCTASDLLCGAFALDAALGCLELRDVHDAVSLTRSRASTLTEMPHTPPPPSNAADFTPLLDARGIGAVIQLHSGSTARVLLPSTGKPRWFAVCREVVAATPTSRGHLEALVIPQWLLPSGAPRCSPTGPLSSIVASRDGSAGETCRCLELFDAVAVVANLGAQTVSDLPFPSWWAVGMHRGSSVEPPSAPTRASGLPDAESSVHASGAVESFLDESPVHTFGAVESFLDSMATMLLRRPPVNLDFLRPDAPAVSAAADVGDSAEADRSKEPESQSQSALQTLDLKATRLRRSSRQFTPVATYSDFADASSTSALRITLWNSATRTWKASLHSLAHCNAPPVLGSCGLEYDMPVEGGSMLAMTVPLDTIRHRFLPGSVAPGDTFTLRWSPAGFDKRAGCLTTSFDPKDPLMSHASVLHIVTTSVVAHLHNGPDTIVATAAIRTIPNTSSRRHVMSVLALAVDESWENCGLGKLLVTQLHSIVLSSARGCAVDVVVKATQRSWPMWHALGATVCADAILIHQAWKERSESFLSFESNAHDSSTVDALICSDDLVRACAQQVPHGRAQMGPQPLSSEAADSPLVASATDHQPLASSRALATATPPSSNDPTEPHLAQEEVAAAQVANEAMAVHSAATTAGGPSRCRASPHLPPLDHHPLDASAVIIQGPLLAWLMLDPTGAIRRAEKVLHLGDLRKLAEFRIHVIGGAHAKFPRYKALAVGIRKDKGRPNDRPQRAVVDAVCTLLVRAGEEVPTEEQLKARGWWGAVVGVLLLTGSATQQDADSWAALGRCEVAWFEPTQRLVFLTCIYIPSILTGPGTAHLGKYRVANLFGATSFALPHRISSPWWTAKLTTPQCSWVEMSATTFLVVQESIQRYHSMEVLRCKEGVSPAEPQSGTRTGKRPLHERDAVLPMPAPSMEVLRCSSGGGESGCSGGGVSGGSRPSRLVTQSR